MDKITKVLLGIIALALIVIAVKIWTPTPAYSGFLDRAPTMADFWNLKNFEGDTHNEARKRLMGSIPLVIVHRVHGTVDVDIQ